MSTRLLGLAGALLVVCVLGESAARAADCGTLVDASNVLALTSQTCTWHGVHTLAKFTMVKSTITVDAYDSGADPTAKDDTGNLQIRALTINIDKDSTITAKGKGYQTLLCGSGTGPTPTASGKGGCSVKDSGGGGAHFGNGGRGTNDNPSSFPAGYEEDCGAAVAIDPTTGVATCTPTTATCHPVNGGDGLPTVAGQAYYHSIYTPEFGASGGDKGCGDGDGTDPRGTTPTGVNVSGPGGGRIVLVGLDVAHPDTHDGTVTIDGTINANGRRGCGNGNDSGGGGAGGTVVIAGDTVTIGKTALVTAAGGLGGDTEGVALVGGKPADPTGECVAPAQQGTTADDCGGGGGGGIVSVLSITGTIDDEATFLVNGAIGGISSLCQGEAGGGVGELQISNGYVGEQCDGFDNDFDGIVDEGFGTISCNGMTKMACLNGVPQQCAPNVPACEGDVTDARARFAVILDTSGSMLETLQGVPTFGDGSKDHLGHDFDGNGKFDDSRLFKAKTALTNVIAGYPDIDFALARYHQDESVDRSCQEAHNFECNNICCSYDDPSNNTGNAPNPACTLQIDAKTPTPTTIADLVDSPTNTECINYAGNCGPPRRGADVLVGFDADINNYLMWLDGTENKFDPSTTQGAYCDFAGGGDCELRATGPTPLANSLNAVEDYLSPIKACDKASILTCRKYGVILLTDGAESCQGDPVAAAAALRGDGISTYVIALSTLPGEKTQLDSIALAGGTGAAFVVNDDNTLANALATIVNGSIVFETCNGKDDDCDGKTDEGFNVGAACNNGLQGACFRTGTLGCTADGSGVTCSAPTVTGTDEICDGIDNDCDGKIDENVSGCDCVAQGETCNNMDDDCDGITDENITRACGTGVCQGIETCSKGSFINCTARTPTTEICNKLDDDCDGVADGFNEDCSTMVAGNDDPTNNPGGDPLSACSIEGPTKCVCHPGIKTCPANGAGVFGACTGEVQPGTEICNGLDDDCDGKIDEGTDGQDCSTNCGTGKTVCTNGAITCTATSAPKDDTCDGKDDDCDGHIDEDYVPGTACDGGGTVCHGMDECINGKVTCVGDSIGPEVCNCLDDNCDGNVDEGSLCGGGGAACVDCQCALPCANGEIQCPSGKACVAGPGGTSYCVIDPCFGHACPPVGGHAQECIIGGAHADQPVCVDICSQVTCAAPLVCKQDTGECVVDNCVSFPDLCTGAQVCIGGACTTNPCAGVTCTNGQYCVGVGGTGTCVSSCADLPEPCASGQRCELGTCVADPCNGACRGGEVCQDATGECHANPCDQVLCAQGMWCDPHGDGTCTNDPCIGTTCPGSGQVCTGGTCDVPPPAMTNDAGQPEFVTTGGGGCSSGGDAGWLVGLGAIVLASRRRKGVAQ